MHAQLEKRVTELKMEFESGQRMLAELEAKQLKVRDTLLRISGAIQALEELIKMDAVEQSGTAFATPEQLVKPEAQAI